MFVHQVTVASLTDYSGNGHHATVDTSANLGGSATCEGGLLAFHNSMYNLLGTAGSAVPTTALTVTMAVRGRRPNKEFRAGRASIPARRHALIPSSSGRGHMADPKLSTLSPA